MMKRTMAKLMILSGMMVMLVSCQEPFNSAKGSGLRIKVSSMSNELSTKTSYSGEVANDRERIDWCVGDNVRIFSEDITLVANATGMNAGGGYNYASGEQKYYHDYTIASNGTARDGYKSDSSLQSEGEGVGLVWVNDPTATATVYGIYPTGESIRTADDRLRGFSGLTVASPDLTWSTRTATTGETTRTARIGAPSATYMQSAFMVAAPTKFVNKKDEETGVSFPTVNLEFYPIFNAFEFRLYGQKENPVTLNSLTLSSTSSVLRGNYAFYYRNRGQETNTYWNNGPLVGGVDLAPSSGEGGSKEVTVTFPSGTIISPNDTVIFTILTLPPADNSPLTNLTLTVNYGGNKSKSLKLNNNVTTSKPEGTPIQFPAFHKARITGLAMDGGSDWQLTIDDQVLPWIKDEQKTSFRNQIGITGRTPVSGYIETAEVTEPGGPVNWENYYTRLTVNCNVADPCIVFTFTPTAPIGGYWRLSPEDVIPGSLNYFKITTSDMINGESERLQGQVMVQPVNIYIRPTAEYLALDPAPVYSIIIHCDMSPSVTFDPLFSADSEFQRPYSDGRFGYYKFVIAK